MHRRHAYLQVAFSDEHIALYLHYDGYLQQQQPALWAKLHGAMTQQPAVSSDPAALQLRCVRRHASNPADPACQASSSLWFCLSPSIWLVSISAISIGGGWMDRELTTALPPHAQAEYHSYAEGGGLLAPGHRDEGSSLTMSVLLSEPQAPQAQGGGGGGFGGGEFITWDGGAQPVAHTMRRGDAVLFHSCRAHNVAQLKHGLRQSLVIELWTRDTNTRNREC